MYYSPNPNLFGSDRPRRTILSILSVYRWMLAILCWYLNSSPQWHFAACCVKNPEFNIPRLQLLACTNWFVKTLLSTMRIMNDWTIIVSRETFDWNYIPMKIMRLYLNHQLLTTRMTSNGVYYLKDADNFILDYFMTLNLTLPLQTEPTRNFFSITSYYLHAICSTRLCNGLWYPLPIHEDDLLCKSRLPVTLWAFKLTAMLIIIVYSSIIINCDELPRGTIYLRSSLFSPWRVLHYYFMTLMMTKKMFCLTWTFTCTSSRQSSSPLLLMIVASVQELHWC